MTFANDEVIGLLQARFVPVAGNTHELQNQKFESSRWFMPMASTVNSRVTGGVTAQGFYVAGPDGKGYGFNNNRTPDRVIRLMRDGLAKFAADPPAHVVIDPAMVSAPYSRQAPKEVAVMSVFSRISPLPPGCDALNHGVGRDFLWLYPEDAAAVRRGETPTALVRRLLRYHLVDNVRGEPDMWTEDQVQRGDFKLRKVSGNRYSLTGAFRMGAGTRGLEGTLEAAIDLEGDGERIKSLRAYAQGRAWGAGTYTPRPPEGKFPIVFAIVPATAAYSRATPPQAALYGDSEYRRPR